MEYLAHRDAKTGAKQLLRDHLGAVSRLAGGFAAPFGAEEAAARCGLLHDIGKYSRKFQLRRLYGDPESVDHSTAGALEASKLGDAPAAFSIAGHHGGLPDRGSKYDSPELGTLCAKLRRRVGAELEDYSAFRSELEIPAAAQPAALLTDKYSAFFYVHMLYSCLVDADWLDTEAFCSPQRGGQRDTGEPLSALSERLDRYIADWWGSEKPINIRRCAVLRAMLEAGGRPRGLYTLTVPTGGGKTVSSMAFALRHALAQGQRRIIYVIPYTSIIEQTQQVFERIFGARNVIAHYADVTYNTDENGDPAGADAARYLATENWDAPVILTTAVQFFQSLYGSHPSQCRKLHNIADSVIIFDEAQMLPVNYLCPCVSAISQLVRSYGCTAVLCTATQPALGPLFRKTMPQLDDAAAELCPNAADNYAFFRRVDYRFEGTLSDEALAEKLAAERQALCIVNSRRQAQRLFSMLPQEGSFHLSTTMTAEHRRAALDSIRKLLAAGEPCRVVSTSLIEAGVDVDFPAVYRAMAGLDSIIQAAGRCNRENRRGRAESAVHVFDTDTNPPLGLEQNIAATRHVLRDHADIASPEAVSAYFNFLLYTLKADTALDQKGILALADDMAFDEVSKSFRLIEQNTITVYVPREEGAALLARLQKHGPSRKLLRMLGQYAVSVYERDYRQLFSAGAVSPLSQDAARLTDLSLYDEQLGLRFDPQSGNAYIG